MFLYEESRTILLVSGAIRLVAPVEVECAIHFPFPLPRDSPGISAPVLDLGNDADNARRLSATAHNISNDRYSLGFLSQREA